MRQYLIFFSILFFLIGNVDTILAQENNYKVYFFPGQGSDSRIFQHYCLPANYECHYFSYPTPEKNISMRDFAVKFIDSIDTSSKFILIGHSLGGMLCTELADTLQPEVVILLSSAKTRKELPVRYQFQHYIPINKAVPKGMVKGGARFLQPIVEPDRNTHKEIFKSMLHAKRPAYLKNTADMIINWERETIPNRIIHIHGNNDHTIPHRNVKFDFLIEDGSHMMALTRGKELNALINALLFLKLAGK